jgi:hypothetical protein
VHDKQEAWADMERGGGGGGMFPVPAPFFVKRSAFSGGHTTVGCSVVLGASWGRLSSANPLPLAARPWLSS